MRHAGAAPSPDTRLTSSSTRSRQQAASCKSSSESASESCSEEEEEALAAEAGRWRLARVAVAIRDAPVPRACRCCRCAASRFGGAARSAASGTRARRSPPVGGGGGASSRRSPRRLEDRASLAYTTTTSVLSWRDSPCIGFNKSWVLRSVSGDESQEALHDDHRGCSGESRRTQSSREYVGTLEKSKSDAETYTVGTSRERVLRAHRPKRDRNATSLRTRALEGHVKRAIQVAPRHARERPHSAPQSQHQTSDLVCRIFKNVRHRDARLPSSQSLYHARRCWGPLREEAPFRLSLSLSLPGRRGAALRARSRAVASSARATRPPRAVARGPRRDPGRPRSDAPATERRGARGRRRLETHDSLQIRHDARLPKLPLRKLQKTRTCFWGPSSAMRRACSRGSARKTWPACHCSSPAFRKQRCLLSVERTLESRIFPVSDSCVAMEHEV